MKLWKITINKVPNKIVGNVSCKIENFLNETNINCLELYRLLYLGF